MKFCKSLNIQNVMFFFNEAHGRHLPGQGSVGGLGSRQYWTHFGCREKPQADFLWRLRQTPLFIYLYICSGENSQPQYMETEFSFQILRVPWTQAGVLSAERASPAMRPINRHSPRRSRAE